MTPALLAFDPACCTRPRARKEGSNADEFDTGRRRVLMEQFKRQRWTGWIRSSQGYSVRIVGRNDLQYVDEARRLSLFVEPLANYTDIVIDTSSIPDMSERSRLELIGRIKRALSVAGWTLIASGRDNPDD
jgi:hypothetical protein